MGKTKSKKTKQYRLPYWIQWIPKQGVRVSITTNRIATTSDKLVVNNVEHILQEFRKHNAKELFGYLISDHLTKEQLEKTFASKIPVMAIHE